MEKKLQQAGWWPLVMAGLAGAVYLPYRSAPAAPADRPVAVQAAAADSSRDAQPSDALTLIGQYLGTDVSEAGMKRRLLAAGRRLEPEPISPASACPDAWERWPEDVSAARRDICEDSSLLGAFFDLDIEPRTRDLAAARLAFTRLRACARDGDRRECRQAVARADRDLLRAFLRDYLDDEALRVDNPPLDARRTAEDFSRLNRSTIAQTEAAHAARRNLTDVSFVVATVPDGVDSFAGWSFDPATDAIRRAAERSGYVMDRFFVPDWSNRSSAVAVGRTHEEQPGAILFRKKSDGKDPRRSLLVVLLALETPTTGVHGAAIDRALRLAGWWKGDAAYPELRILGPFYSGTTLSLQQSLRRVLPGSGVKEVRIISGSATSGSNKADLEDPTGERYGAKVTFAATTLPDDRCRLREQLRDEYGVTRMAWLTESNTIYGTSQAPEKCPALAGDVYFPFPLHISRLRDLSPAGAADRQTVNTLIPLVLREAFTPSDSFPSLSPSLTSAGAEMLLRNLGRLIARARIHVVGITATDARDKLFLARAIRQMQPSASFVTTEANILYSHPDYADSARGMLVASSYPLASFVPESVPATGPEAGRVFFASSAAEGIYNAALVQMNRHAADDPDLSFLVYGRESIPADQERRPSLWFSLVGREDVWPIERSATSASGLARTDPRATYTLTAPNRPSRISADFALERVHTGVQVGYLALSLIVVSHVLAFFIGWPGWLRRLASRTPQTPGQSRHLTEPAAPWIAPLRRRNQGGRYRRQLACFASLLVVYATSVALQMVWARELGLLAGMVTRGSLLLLAAIATVSLICAVRLARTVPSRNELSRHWAERAAYSGIVLIVGVACTAGWGGFAYGLLRARLGFPEAGALVVERYARLSNGLSPILPLVLLAAVVYLWGFLDLSAHPVPMHRRFNDSLKLVNELTGLTRAARDRERSEALTTRLLAVVCVLALGVWLVRLTPIFSFEGRAYGYTYAAAVLLVHALVMSKLLAVWHRWGVFSRRLDQLARSEHWLVKLIVPTAAADGAEAPRPPEFGAALLFKGPRLDEVERLCKEYEIAVAKAPRLLRDGLGQKDAAYLETLTGLDKSLCERWSANPPVNPAAAPGFNPLRLFELLDRRAFDELFDATCAAVLGECIETPTVRATAVGTSASALAAPAAERFVETHAEIAQAWRRAFGQRLPAGVDAACCMWWVAMQPDAADIRALIARSPILPIHVRKHLDDDKQIADDMPGSVSRAWEALTRIATAAARVEPAISGNPSACGCQVPDRVEQDAIARFLALYLFSAIRMAIWRIWRPLAFIMAAILLITLSHLVYPIQPRSLLLGVTAIEVLMGAALAVRAMLALERNVILSRLTGGHAGQIDWSWRFAGRLVGWVALPVAGVVASRFPEIGDFVLKLFSPLETLTR